MSTTRAIALALLLAAPLAAQEDRAPRYDQFTGQPLPPLPSSSTPSPQSVQPQQAPAPVQPVGPGTTVAAPTTVSIPGQTIQVQQAPPTVLFVSAPAQSIAYQAAPAPVVQALYVQAAPSPIVQQSVAAVQPVSIIHQRGPIHKCLGHLGSKMAGLGQPYVTTVNQAVQVQAVQQAPFQAVQYVMTAAPAPAVQQYAQQPPSPAKASPQR